MATNYDINYDDKRFTEVENDKSAAIKESNEMYDGMISNSDKFYDKQIAASKEYAETQKKNQQAATDFAIEKVEQQKDQAKSDYLKEQSGAYTDWQKQSGAYGVNAEQMAASGLSNSGYSESSQVAMYTAYQNRVATAREAYQRAVLNYDNAITEARLQNNAALAEIAYNALQQQLELSLAGFQYKNTLLLSKAETKREIDNTYYSRYQDVLKQINTENTLAEQIRQHEASMAENKRQFNEQMALSREQFEWQKAQAAKSSSSGGSGTIKKSSSSGSSSSSSKKGAKAAGKDTASIRESRGKSFSGSTYDQAVAYMEKNGVPSSYASNVLTEGEFKYGRGAKYKEYTSYAAYLKDYCAFAVANYKG